MTPAEELRAAAGLLREKPAPEPHPKRLPPKMPDVYAEPIAAWLDSYATWAEETTYSDLSGLFHATCGCTVDGCGCGCFNDALAVARVINGTAP